MIFYQNSKKKITLCKILAHIESKEMKNWMKKSSNMYARKIKYLSLINIDNIKIKDHVI